ncbi:hypothetical protein ACWEV3_01240 [Saccharopolyspora sp. NPDC003752]
MDFLLRGRKANPEIEAAIEILERAAARMDSIGARALEGYADVLMQLSDARDAVGQHTVAVEDLEIALSIMRRAASPAYVTDVLARLGRAAAALGHTSDARTHYREALELFLAVGDHANPDRISTALDALDALQPPRNHHRERPYLHDHPSAVR